MKFWASAEVYRPAFAAVDTIRRRVVPFLNGAFAESELATLECELRYVPIVMPEGMHERYPPRSMLHTKQRLYDCAPTLDYGVFVDGDFESQLREYFRGIALSGPHLVTLGATPEQVDEFNAILAGAADRLLDLR